MSGMTLGRTQWSERFAVGFGVKSGEWKVRLESMSENLRPKRRSFRAGTVIRDPLLKER